MAGNRGRIALAQYSRTGKSFGKLDTTIDPVRARWFRLRILEATQEPTILELQFFSPTEAGEGEDS